MDKEQVIKEEVEYLKEEHLRNFKRKVNDALKEVASATAGLRIAKQKLAELKFVELDFSDVAGGQ
jgi:hypothetical protein